MYFHPFIILHVSICGLEENVKSPLLLFTCSGEIRETVQEKRREAIITG